MSYYRILNYFQSRMHTGSDLVESVIASVMQEQESLSSQSLLDLSSDPSSLIETIKAKLIELGFAVSDEPVLGQHSSLLSIRPSELMQMFIMSTEVDLLGESDQDTDDKESEADENENPETFTKNLLKHTDPKEVYSDVVKICSKSPLPITSEYKEWLNQIFNLIPMNHCYRPLIVKTALKILKMTPSDFKRDNDQIVQLTKESFYLEADVGDNNCAVCQTAFKDCCNRLTDPLDRDRILYLVCGKFYGEKCPHNFCYTCFQLLQTTLIGDNCPVCRQHYKEISL